MPKIVDYAARFEFIREAAFAVVLEGGPSGLSRRVLADTLGMSLSTVRRLVRPDASLAAIAAQAVQSRRSHGRWGIPRGDDRLLNATRLLASLIPETEDRIDEELVWLKLVLMQPRVAPATARKAIRGHYDLFDHGWSDEPEEPAEVDEDSAMARAIAEREYFVRQRLHRLLDELGIPDHQRRRALLQLRVHLDGVTLGVSLGHLRPDEAVELGEHILRVWMDTGIQEADSRPPDTLTA